MRHNKAAIATPVNDAKKPFAVLIPAINAALQHVNTRLKIPVNPVIFFLQERFPCQKHFKLQTLNSKKLAKNHNKNKVLKTLSKALNYGTVIARAITEQACCHKNFTMKKMNYFIASTLISGVLCFVIKFATESLPATKSSMKEDGTLVEPYFFLIPIGWLLLLIGFILLILKIVSTITKQKR